MVTSGSSWRRRFEKRKNPLRWLHMWFPQPQRVKGRMVCDSPSTSDILRRKAACEQLFTHHKCWYPEAVCTTEKVTGNSTFLQITWEEAAWPMWLKAWTGWHHKMTGGWALQWHQRQKNPAAITRCTAAKREGARLTVSRHILHPRPPKQSSNLWKSQIMIQRPAGEPGAFQPCAAREG